MDVREKLIDLIIDAKRIDPETGSFTEYLADYLINSGVTVQEWVPADKRMPTQEDAPTEYVFTAYKNQNC